MNFYCSAFSLWYFIMNAPETARILLCSYDGDTDTWHDGGGYWRERERGERGRGSGGGGGILL